MKLLRKAITAGGLIVMASTATTGLAVAEVVEKGEFHAAGSEVLEDFCGLTVRVDFDVSGTFLAVATGKDGLVHFSGHEAGSVYWTNEENGNTLGREWRTNSRDLKVTDNGDGTLTILIMASGPETWYANGEPVFRNPGQLRWEILVDHAGTPDDPSDDVFLEDLGVVKGSTGRNDTDGRDFCEDVNVFLG